MLERFVSDNGKNFMNYNNPEYDALYETALNATDEDTQTEAYKAMEQMLTEDAANLYIRIWLTSWLSVPTCRDIPSIPSMLRTWQSSTTLSKAEYVRLNLERDDDHEEHRKESADDDSHHGHRLFLRVFGLPNHPR